MGKVLAKRVAIVTGGSRGIGRAVAEAFLKEGAAVAIAARTAREVRQAVQELGRRSPARVMGARLDVADYRAVQRFIGSVTRRLGTIDILVNAAAVQGPIGLLVENDAKAWADTVTANLIGTMYATRAVLAGMMARKYGKVINFSGGGATAPRPGFSAYAASKAAVVRFTETLALEVAPCRIDVNAIAPGLVATRMLDEVIASGSKAPEAERQSAIACRIRGDRSARKAAELAVFLASPASDGVTGRLISAVWDDWRKLLPAKGRGLSSSLYTLRRIDGRRFREAR